MAVYFYLVSRGAELTNTNLIRRVEERKLKEAETLSGIKRKMERLKMRQERLHQKSTIDSDDHFIGKCEFLHAYYKRPLQMGSYLLIIRRPKRPTILQGLNLHNT